MLSRARAPSTFKRSSLGLDLYLWTTCRPFALKRPLRLSWPHLSWSTPSQGKSLIPELPIPPAPPTISIRECQEAIEIAGVITITLRGERMRITEIATRDISRWVSGDIRFTPKEKELLTKRAREIYCGQGQKLPNSPSPPQGSPQTAPCESRAYICAPPPKFARSILSDCRCEVYPQAAVIRGSFRQVVRSGCSCGQTDPETEPRNKTAAAAGVSFFTLLLTLSVIQTCPRK